MAIQAGVGSEPAVGLTLRLLRFRPKVVGPQVAHIGLVSQRRPFGTPEIG
jgi:hypothetical protein